MANQQKIDRGKYQHPPRRIRQGATAWNHDRHRGARRSQSTQLVEDDYQEGIARGVSKTPTVFVNGEPFVETFKADEIAKAIQTALDTAKRE